MVYLLNYFYFPSDINPTTSNGTCSVSDASLTCMVCSGKCQFSFESVYFSATCYTIPSGLQFSDISTDTLNPSPITFNENQYSIKEIFLNVYSWGIYAASPCCEIVMVCISPNGMLIICIPVNITTSSQSVAIPSTIPSINGDITSSDITGVSLSNYFPTGSSGSFVYYQGPYSKEGLTADYIVFPESTLSIASYTVAEITKATGNTTTQYQTNIPGKTANYISGNIYYNVNGASSSLPSSDEIYIECNPTDYSDSDVINPTSNSPTIINNGNSQSSIVWFIIMMVFFFAIIFASTIRFIQYRYSKS